MARAVYQCPNCKEYISSDAAKCRFCSAPIDEAAKQQAITLQAKENKKYRKRQYQKHMLIGLGVSLGGLIITIITYTIAASSEGGGHYVVTYGLIIGGALDALYGLVGWIGEMRSKE